MAKKQLFQPNNSLQNVSDVTEEIQHAAGRQWDRGDNIPEMHVLFLYTKILCNLFSHIRRYRLKMSSIHWNHQHTL